MWNVRDPCVLFSDELSRRDNKGLSNQDGEVLIPINKQRQSSRREQHIASGAKVRKDDLDAGADSQKFMLGYACRIIDECGRDA